jgi:hypothetical protein
MKALALIIATSLSVGTAALAQQTTVRGNASADSQTSVSADRQGAGVASDNRAQGGVAVERGNEDGAGRQAAAADFAGASEMNATLERSVDARRAKPGDEVTAKTNESFTAANGTTIPRGSRLVGRVTQARAHARGEGAAASQLGIVFDRAELPDGRVVPMQATIQAVAAAESHAQRRLGSASHGAGAFGSSHASGGGYAGGGLSGGAIGGIGGAAGGVAGAAGGIGATGGSVFGSAAGQAGGAVGGATRLPRSGVGATASGAATATAGGGLSASGQWLAGSRGVFGIGDLELASAAAGNAQGSLITSASRNVRLDSGTRLLLVGSAGATRR